jgi:hypothetical protein
MLYSNNDSNTTSSPFNQLISGQRELTPLERLVSHQLLTSLPLNDKPMLNPNVQNFHQPVNPTQGISQPSPFQNSLLSYLSLNRTNFHSLPQLSNLTKDEKFDRDHMTNKEGSINTSIKLEENKYTSNSSRKEYLASIEGLIKTEHIPQSTNPMASRNIPEFTAGKPALADLTQLFPEWDLGQIVAFLSNEDDSVVQETQEELTNKRLERELLENDEDTANPSAPKVRKTRAWKNKFFTANSVPQKKVTPVSSKITYIKRLKQVTGLKEINSDRAHKLLTENFMDPKKAVLKVKRNLSYYQKFLSSESE